MEFFAPVSSSIGVQLLQKMGWRQGKGIGSKAPSTSAAAAASKRTTQRAPSHKPSHGDRSLGILGDMAGFRGPAAAGGDGSDSEGEAQAGAGSKWGTVAGVTIENTPLYVLDPKQDLHGLGFDPFEGAEEFRSRKRQKTEAARAAAGGGQAGEAGFSGSGRGQRSGSRARGVAFGTGALEESDTLGYVEDYVDADADIMASRGRRNEVFAFEEASDSGNAEVHSQVH